MNEENIIFQYQVKKRTKFGTRYYYFYATTDIENYLNNKDIKYVRYAKDTALNKQQKRIRELFKENKQLKTLLMQDHHKIHELADVIDEVREYTNDKLFDDYTYCSYEDLKQNINEILDKAKGE